MKISEIKYDKNYPYIIQDAWSGKVYCKLEDLKELKKEIEKIINEKEKKK